MTKTKEVVEYYLTTVDRCDRCSAQAYVRATGVNGELYFCGHHFVFLKHPTDSSQSLLNLVSEVYQLLFIVFFLFQEIYLKLKNF